MKRPEQHETDSAGQRLLRNALEPLGCTLNGSVHDYGWDFDVEVFEGGTTTGITFKLQLKSSRHSKYSANGDFISERLELDSARYISRELCTPTILVHADVSAGRVFWAAPQVDPELLAKLADSATQGSVVVRVPTENALPGTWIRLLAAVSKSALLLATRKIVATPITDFLAGMTVGPDHSARAEAFLQRAELLKLHSAQQLFRARRVEEALMVANAICDDPTASTRVRFNAECLRELYRERQVGPRAPWFRLDAVRRESIHRARELVREGPPDLKLYAILRAAALSLNSLVEQYHGLAIIGAVNSDTGDPLALAIATGQKALVAARIDRKYSQIRRLAGLMLSSPHLWALGGACAEVARSVAHLACALRTSDETAAANTFKEVTLQWCKLAFTIGEAYKDPHSSGSAIMAATMLRHADADAWVTVAVQRISDPQTQKEAVGFLREVEASRNLREKAPPAPGTPEAFEIERQIYAHMAASLGIDVSDPNDPIARMVRVGLKDLDPSRVLRRCEHIYLQLSWGGLAASEILRLPTAGAKTLFCTKHDVGCGAPELDRAYAALRDRHCDNCPDESPRPAWWRPTEEWWREQSARFGKQFKGQF